MLNLEGMTDEQRAVAMPIWKAVEESVKGAVASAIKPEVLGEALKPTLTGLVTEIVKANAPAAPAGGGEPEKKGAAKKGEETGGDEPPAWAKGILDTVEQLKAKEAEREQASQTEAQKRAARTLAEKVVSTRRPKLSESARNDLIESIAAQNPADETAALAAANAHLTRLKAYGITVEPLSASPAAEGAKDAPEEGSDEATIQKLRQSRRGGALV